jgi:hypothetical protein
MEQSTKSLSSTMKGKSKGKPTPVTSLGDTTARLFREQILAAANANDDEEDDLDDDADELDEEEEEEEEEEGEEHAGAEEVGDVDATAQSALERTTKSLSSTMKGKGKSKPAAVNLMSPDALSASRLSREERLSSSQAGDELDADGNDRDARDEARTMSWSGRPSRSAAR